MVGRGVVARIRCCLLALALLCVVSLLVCNLASSLRIGPDTTLVTTHHEQTITSLHLDLHGGITRCQVLEVKLPEEERAALAAISRERPVLEVTFSQMLDTLLRCQRLDAVRSRDLVLSHPAERHRWNTFTLLRGLLPGTKWCGLGDEATGWNDLGPNVELDRCCRTHDLCPVKVSAYKRRYGLFNWSPYTKSHCACDLEFQRCLRASTSSVADSVGRLFFDVMRPQCVRGPSCEPHVTARQCAELVKAAGADGHYRFSTSVWSYRAAGRLTDGGRRPSAAAQGGSVPTAVSTTAPG